MSEVPPLHVLHVVSGDLWAGAEVQLFTLAKTLHHTQGCKITVVVLNHGRLEQELRNTGIDVIVLDETSLNGFQIFFRLIHIIRKLKPDVIHTHRNKENVLGSFAARFSGNIPCLRTAHGAPEHRSAWYRLPKQLILFMDWFSGYFLQKRIIAVSDELASILEQDYPSNKLTVINNGIDVKSLSQLDEPDTQPIAPGATFKIGIAGRLVPVKRVDLFIRTARQLQKDFPELNASFHVFGDGPLRKELKSLNQQLDTNNQVIFEGHCEDMHVQLQQLDALLMTSDHEGLPMILLEAMALQTPVIAHAVGGIPDLLDQGDSGILVFEHTASAYARAIHQLFTATEARTAIIKHALHRVSNFYSAEKNARAYLDVYNQLIQKR